ncbi:MAG: amino acid ABC transporter permease [Betaproteobacteria bacterium]|nr:amino acid ABC transporter permease [Betaproteobacteria bacterium]MDH5210848.1 amino acid ABC transporter permease [Betaproteobacteria bacterium]
MSAAPPGTGWAPIVWARENLFYSVTSSLVTLLLAYIAWQVLVPFIDWAVVNAIWSAPDSKPCRAARGVGACWALITEKHRFILFGTYPYEQHWRPTLCILLLLALYVVSAMRRFWRPALAGLWLTGLAAIGVLMWGGLFGMAYVENERWGGLMLTLLLATFGIAAAFPLSILLALGRRSDMPAVRVVCIGYIELIRGVPLISLLIMASVMLPLFLPEGVSIDKLLRAQIAMILFAAAYLAEVVRGGLQAVPQGQVEAADAMGLSYWRKTMLIVLPQALRVAIPPLVNTFIGFFKDTSLVVIIGLFDLLTSIKVAIVEPAWSGFGVEAYLFASLVYFAFCYAMSQYSQNLERELARGKAHYLREN